MSKVIFGFIGGILGTVGAAHNYNSYPVLSLDNFVGAITHCIAAFSSLFIGITRMASLKIKNMWISIAILLGVTTLAQIANGRLTLVGGMQNLPVSAVIVGDEAFDINYLNTSAYAQQKLLNWYNSGKTVYIKLSKNTLVNTNGQEVSFEALPNMLRYFDSTGIKLFSK